MIFNLIVLLAMQSQKSQVVLAPFAKVDTINSSRFLIHYSCAERWVKQTGFFPVYMDERFVGISSCHIIDREGWVQAKLWLNREVGDDYVLRPRLKVRRSEFSQDGCYWKIHEADITGMVFTKNPSRYD